MPYSIDNKTYYCGNCAWEEPVENARGCPEHDVPIDASRPYRVSIQYKEPPRAPTRLEEAVYFFRFLRSVRRWLGGHWERMYDFGGPHAIDDEGWLPWRQLPRTQPVAIHSAAALQCEDWGPIRGQRPGE